MDYRRPSSRAQHALVVPHNMARVNLPPRGGLLEHPARRSSHSSSIPAVRGGRFVERRMLPRYMTYQGQGPANKFMPSIQNIGPAS